MPVNKKDNKKNAPAEIRDSAIVPRKEEVAKKRPKKTQLRVARTRVNSLATAGKKKKPK